MFSHKNTIIFFFKKKAHKNTSEKTYVDINFYKSSIFFKKLIFLKFFKNYTNKIMSVTK